MEEEWRGLIYNGVDYSDRYEISSMGNLRNSRTKKMVKQHVSKTGYSTYCASLGCRGKYKLFRIHRGVAETFIENPNNYPVVNHIDGNKTNNCVNNLEWCTISYNAKHAVDKGLITPKRGTESPTAKLTEEDVVFIRQNYKPRDREFGTRALGRKFNVSHRTIEDVVHEKTYKNI